MAKAPIIVFAYNRPLLLRKTLESLKKNELSVQSDLFVFADGPKPNATANDLANIALVRKVVKEQQWCKSVSLNEQTANKGLAASVIAGVSEIVNKYGKVIVVEDDVLLSPYFLDYMNDALDRYENAQEILSIGSWNYFCSPQQIKEDQFLLRFPDSIAWATYKRSWDLFETDGQKLYDKLKSANKLSTFNADSDTPYFENMLKLQIEGKVNSWAIRWTGTAVLHNKLSVFPKETMSKHIGVGIDATHEKGGDDYNKYLVLAQRKMNLCDIPLKETREALDSWKKFIETHFGTKKVPGFFEKIIPALKYRRHRAYKVLTDRLQGHRSTEISMLIDQALKFPRYTAHEFKFRGYSFKVTDFISVAYQVKEYFVDQRLKFNGFSEKPLIIDCGSNVGVSVVYFKSLWPQARLIAFEPDKQIFSCLEQNIKNNNLTGVELNNKAVWINNDGVEFASEGADGGSIHLEGKKIKVPTKRLKDLLKENTYVDLLKIDIEGAEAEVIKDCAEDLSKVHYLFVEYHSFINTGQKLHEMLETLNKCGFRYYIHSIGNQAQKPFVAIDNYNGMDVQLDIYAVNTKIV